MYFRIMDYREYIPNFALPNWQSIALSGIRFYTWITMMWQQYAPANFKHLVNNNINDSYPFAVVGKNNLQKLVYYSDIEPTDYTFISGVVRVNDRDEYDLLLRSFFVVGNRILDRDFIRWYLKLHHRVSISEDESDQYEIYIMNQNLEQITVRSNECIKLNKDNYLKIKSDE